ncbi:MAG: hypothetical protein IT425_04150 [Pirellulales bacterium]|nr:hypothetical protein [Pirellulales bacterium]
MESERNLGVNETRFALTLFICLLVAFGYIVLLRVGTSGEGAVELRPENAPVERIVLKEETPTEVDQPQVVPIEPEGSNVPLVSQRPESIESEPRGESPAGSGSQRR